LIRNSPIFVILRVLIENHCPHTPKAIDLPVSGIERGSIGQHAKQHTPSSPPRRFGLKPILFETGRPKFGHISGFLGNNWGIDSPKNRDCGDH
jgi:hypothetical protein